MKFYAIKQKSSGFLVPAGGKGKRGHTYQEPSATLPPRLFTQQHIGQRCLSNYLLGKWREHYSTDSYTGEQDYSGPEPDSHTKRDPNDFELVEVRLSVSSLTAVQTKTKDKTNNAI